MFKEEGFKELNTYCSQLMQAKEVSSSFTRGKILSTLAISYWLKCQPMIYLFLLKGKHKYPSFSFAQMNRVDEYLPTESKAVRTENSAGNHRNHTNKKRHILIASICRVCHKGAKPSKPCNFWEFFHMLQLALLAIGQGPNIRRLYLV